MLEQVHEALWVVDGEIVGRARDKALSWNCQRVIVAHGEWPRADGTAFLAKSFRWLGA